MWVKISRCLAIRLMTDWSAARDRYTTQDIRLCPSWSDGLMHFYSFMLINSKISLLNWQTAYDFRSRPCIRLCKQCFGSTPKISNAHHYNKAHDPSPAGLDTSYFDSTSLTYHEEPSGRSTNDVTSYMSTIKVHALSADWQTCAAAWTVSNQWGLKDEDSDRIQWTFSKRCEVATVG